MVDPLRDTHSMECHGVCSSRCAEAREVRVRAAGAEQLLLVRAVTREAVAGGRPFGIGAENLHLVVALCGVSLHCIERRVPRADVHRAGPHYRRA